MVTFAEQLYMQARTRNREYRKRDVTERLMLEMRDRVRSNGAEFAIALLWTNEPARAHYRAFCAERGIALADCVFTRTKDMFVPGDPHHLNGKMNDRWADCIQASLAGTFERLEHQAERRALIQKNPELATGENR